MANNDSYIDKYVLSPIREFLDDSRTVGVVLLCCAVLSIWLSNSSAAASYQAFWDNELFSSPVLHLPHTPLHIINDALMALFFLLVGMEIKRELLDGELSDVQKGMLPVIAALGGMVVPAFIYFLFCGNTPFSGGWGIPMATDIAFSLGILSLLGKKAPISIRILLMALAIIDDLGGIVTIAIFYTKGLNGMFMGLAGITLLILVAMNFFKVRRGYSYMIVGTLLWYFVYNSGVHATIAGVLLAFTIPMRNINRMIHAYHDPVSFIILPVFALANTAITLPGDLGHMLHTPLTYALICGLVIGKPLGIFSFSYLAVKTKIGALPDHMGWRHLLGMGMIAGIGFTISIFIVTLAFPGDGVQSIAKIAVLIASILSGVIGYVYLRFLNKRIKKAVSKANR
ncbi:MAG: Na+/H+ antiporter NhaA [Bacteroidetes bacterium 46-16]|nr:MAG: Na+/H+ antiporter NhaA [Bacteroidetes bacterium 46-16]